MQVYNDETFVPAYNKCEARTDGTAFADYELRRKIGKCLFDVLPAFQIKGRVFAPSKELELGVWLSAEIG